MQKGNTQPVRKINFFCSFDKNRESYTNLMNYLYINKENNKISCVLQTDLSAAYDTIDHQVLLNKIAILWG